jgi:hypothetical protein
MRSSRLGILTLIVLTVFLTTNCAYFNRIMSRKNLVDGSVAYKERKFDVAADLFRRAAERDPEGETLEGRTAQLFLARTIHSQYIGNRQDQQLAERAIAEYQKMLAIDPNEQSSYKAVAGLYENLQRNDDWMKWVTDRSTNENIQPHYRAEALTSLAARQNTCANEISGSDANRKQIQRDGKDVYQYVKPANAQDLERMRSCVQQGMQYTEQALSLETDEVKNAGSMNIQGSSDADLRAAMEKIKAFESARSYRASMLIQASRLAEMDGNEAEATRLRNEADAARESFLKLSEASTAIQNELDARVAAQQAANANANANANTAPAEQ